jgi:CubicO group peptidase (beta-lactamase class C family)
LPPPELSVAELSRLVRDAQANERIPSISAAAVGNGKVVWQEALGLAGVEPEERATVDTQYRVGSITKTFTAAAVMQLRDAGELSLDDRLEQHLPDADQGTLTLRRMLAHISGLQREMPGYVWETLDFPDPRRPCLGSRGRRAGLAARRALALLEPGVCAARRGGRSAIWPRVRGIRF